MNTFVRQMSRAAYQMERKIYHASAALPGAGAFTADGWFELPDSAISRITAWCAYTRGAANGQAEYRVSFSDRLMTGAPVLEEARDVVIDQTLAVSQPEDNQSLYQQTLLGPVLAGAVTDSTIALDIRVPVGAVSIRILAAEVGVPATPGTLRIALTGGS